MMNDPFARLPVVPNFALTSTDVKVTFVQLTEHPMPVEGLVVDQSPGPSAKVHRRGELMVQVWHPPA